MDYKKISVTAIVVTLLFFGCENSIQPLNKEKGIFSIYGYLDLNKEANYIRVKDLNKTLLADTTGSIDAEVTLKSLKTGQTQKLEDTVVVFDGVQTHNFRATMDIQPDTRYRVSAESSEGDVISAETTTPHIAKTEVKPLAANCTTNVVMSFEPIRSKFALRLEVGFKYNSQKFWTRQHMNMIEYDNRVILSFTPLDILESFTDSREIVCEELDSDMYFVRYTHYGPGLYGNEVKDTLSVPGGAGNFGAYYKDSFKFPIDTVSLCPPICP